jgi:hypothetical protein
MSESDVTSRDIEQPQPAAKQAAPAAREPVRIPLINIALPGPISGFFHSVDDTFEGTRQAAIKALPAPILNNSSNLLGAAHVWTEIVMFKASLKGGKLVENASNPLDYAVKAISRVYSEAFKGAFSKRDNNVKIFEGNPFKNVYRIITDTDGATQREIEHQMSQMRASGVTKKISLPNTWQTRSTLAGLTAWSLSAMIPDKKESEEEVERMRDLRDKNPLGYAGERFKQALWVPQWPDHKRQMIGLGIMTSGTCSMLGAWRNRATIGDVTKYKFNGSYFATGALTFISSMPLLFSLTDKDAFNSFGGWMLGRLFFLPTSISAKLKNKEEGTNWYIGATAGFQAENLAQAMIGGVEKLPDGTIVDHSKHKKKAPVTHETTEPQMQPSTRIAEARDHAMAMPQQQKLAMA